MTNGINFDELAKKSFSPGATTADYEKLFGAAFGLAEWHFIADGVFPNIAPYCAVFPGYMEDQPMVAAFTDIERLRKFKSEKSLLKGEASTENLILSIPTVSVLGYLDNLIQKGIQGIFFNANTDSHGFFIGLRQLRPIREHLENAGMLSKTVEKSAEMKTPEAEKAEPISQSTTEIPASVNEKIEEKITQTEPQIEATSSVDFDQLSRNANDSNGAMEPLNELFGAAFALSEWLFIARGEMPNVNPYIAANPAYADGQQMMRAFTDSTRLQRFAQENNLTRPDGSCDILSIPTDGIVEYLEQFMPYGVHGVWFNSDSQSDGFFIPIKQLQPIKNHLAKINQKHPEPEPPPPPSIPKPEIESVQHQSEIETVLIRVKDGLAMPSGFISQADYACNFYCRVPSNWNENGVMKEENIEKIYRKVYGDTWRSGNSDGSRYVVLDSTSRILTNGELRSTDWSNLKTIPEDQYWFYIAEPDGGVKSIKADEFQKEIEAALPPAEPVVEQDKQEAIQNKQANLENWGLSMSPDGGFDQNLDFFIKGDVDFGTALVPFFEHTVPLLKDYQGSGEYADLFSYDRNAMSNIFENIVKNEHGDYLQVFNYTYQPSASSPTIRYYSINSNQLRHVQAQSPLLVNFALGRNLDNSTATIYIRFAGPGGEVRRLIDTIRPILAFYNFKQQD